jgi:16S rRNA (cytosine1402-N4)-methyltransferase
MTDSEREHHATDPYSHEPVMVREILDALAPITGGVVLDATVGGGGHARAILQAHDDVTLVGLDRDDDALAAAADALASFGDRVVLRRSGFDRLAAECQALGVDAITAFLFDLGVSSPQLDRAGRGFSYRSEGPLDMRMDRRESLTAHTVVNEYDERRLAEVLRRYGDERFALRIARAIVAARPIGTTLELSEIVRQAIPAATRRRGGHPAKRTFQAIRIEVNRELDVLPRALDDAIDLLQPAGRGAVLSYHSGEDRIVKRVFTDAATGGCVCPPRLPCQCGARARVKLVWRGGRTPSAEEAARNARAESARLRAVERLPAVAGAA